MSGAAENEWIAWEGGGRPVDPDTLVEVKMSDDPSYVYGKTRAGYWTPEKRSDHDQHNYWTGRGKVNGRADNSVIIAYRVIQ